MTVELTDGNLVAKRIAVLAPGARVEASGKCVYLQAADLVAVATALRDDPELRMQYLVGMTAVDYVTHFETVYHVRLVCQEPPLRAQGAHRRARAA